MQKERKGKDVVYSGLCGAFATVVICLTVLNRSVTKVNTAETVYKTMIELFNGSIGAIYDFVFNVFMFVPIGFLLSIKLKPPPSALIIILSTFALEVTQILTKRGLFEISDLLANFLGGIIGIFVYASIKNFYGYAHGKEITGD